MHTFRLLFSLLAVLSFTLAAPQASRATQVNSCKGRLRGQRALCLAYLHGRKPSQSTHTNSVTTTATLPAATSTVPLTLSQTTTLTETQTAFETTTITTATTETDTATDVTTITTTVTPPAVARRALPTMEPRSATNIRSVAAGFADDIITDACLLIVYGTLSYPPKTVTATLTSSTQLPTSTVTSTAFATETDTLTDTITNTLTATSTLTSTTTTTTTSTAMATVTAPASCASLYTCGSSDFSYCDGGSSGCICVGDENGTLVTCVPGSTTCDSVPTCQQTSDCASGSVCAVSTCCDSPVCVPVQYVCQAITARDYLLGRDGPVNYLGDMFRPH